ncbi:CD48 antigen-like isoform X2 [Engystomops pustulosus]|uniref:CD48 antigen-like isoform X2 n=1 Tax=Engystomops pustulosus TaxID=76066 RepID=UPI003AFA7E97
MQPHLGCTALTMITAAEVIPLLLTLLSPGGQAVDRRVAGLLHHSVELYHPDLPHPVLDVIWNFQNQTKITKVFMYNSGHETTYSPQFADRLEASNNGTKLRIKDLRMEDTGAYTSIITFVDNDVFQVTYHLTVYEPVPPLDIQTEVTGYRKDGCNVTLQCSVPSHPLHLSYTWKYRHQDQEYQPYDSGSTTQISLAPDHQDMEILCIVHNPADQKNVSISVKSCFSTEQPRRWYILSIISLLVILMVGIILLMWKIRRKHAKEDEAVEYYLEEVPTPESSTNTIQPLVYDEVPHRSQPPPQKFESLYCLGQDVDPFRKEDI